MKVYTYTAMVTFEVRASDDRGADRQAYLRLKDAGAKSVLVLHSDAINERVFVSILTPPEPSVPLLDSPPSTPCASGGGSDSSQVELLSRRHALQAYCDAVAAYTTDQAQ